jgi:protein-tyrosine sulfotransferase
MSDAPPKTYEGVIVLGLHRSGTTLLRRILDAHPAIACPSETYVFSGFARLMREDRFVDATLGVVSGLAYAGIEPEESVARLRELAFDFHRVIAKRQNKAIWASKSTSDTFYVDEIETLCGDASRFVVITRHGGDVVCSVQELTAKQEAYLPEVWEYLRRCPYPLEAFAEMWCDVTARLDAFAAAHPENCLAIRYEDLAAEPGAVMAKVFAFLGVDFDQALLETALTRRENIGPGDFKAYQRTGVDTASVGRWKELSNDTKSRLGAILNPTLIAHGYEPLPIKPIAAGESMRRRYQMGLLLQSMKPK